MPQSSVMSRMVILSRGFFSSICFRDSSRACFVVFGILPRLLFVLPDHCRDGLRRYAGAQLTGVDAVGGVEILGVGQLVKPPAYVGDQGIIFLCRFVVGLGQLLEHLVVVPALVCRQSCSTLEKKLLEAVMGPWLISWSTT